MIEEILPNLFKIELPLPNNPLRSINSYVVKGPERNVTIDPGMNQKECKEAMEAALNRLGIDLTKTDFFITHFHKANGVRLPHAFPVVFPNPG
jgi:hypothetical protein